MSASTPHRALASRPGASSPAAAPQLVRVTEPDKRRRRGGSAGPKADCGPRRPSTRGRWRASSLILVHVAVAIHIAHWLTTRNTITPVEPSESMQTLGSQALLNAGFVFFVLLILGTLVFGRFFCGWACHIVALQDLCTWLLRRMRITVKPFRSRLLVFVPIGAALYMFVMPTLVRLWLHGSRDPLRAHFYTRDFWDRFPSWPIALLTFGACGFLVVYFLGNKGFCTYGCPYGGIFGLADRLAPGKIRVTDACEGCGHCTATCTSNVRVHEEVRTFGMVVNPGCMKCMDCITVCPMDALYFGFGSPTVAKGKPRVRPPAKVFDFTWPEEIGLALCFIAAIPVLAGLYDRVPFLLALGLAAMSSYVLVTAARMAYVTNLRFSRHTLRQQGKITLAGAVFLTLVTGWVAFLGHSGLTHWVTVQGIHVVDRGEALAAASSGPGKAEAVETLRRGIHLLETAGRLSLVPMGRIEAGMGDAYDALGDRANAEAHYIRALKLAPKYTAGRVKLASYLSERGEYEAAVSQLREAVRVDPATPNAAGDLADLLVQRGRAAEAASLIAAALAQRPFDADLRLNHGVLLAHLGKVDSSLAEIDRVTAARPNDAEAYLKRGQILAAVGRLAEASPALERAVELRPEFIDGHVLAAQAAFGLGDVNRARRHLEQALDLDPYSESLAATWARVVARMGGLDPAIAAAERASDGPTRFRLVHLYRAAGRNTDAARIAAELNPPATPR